MPTTRRSRREAVTTMRQVKRVSSGHAAVEGPSPMPVREATLQGEMGPNPSPQTRRREGTTYIVIPTLNEAANLRKLIPQLAGTLSKTSYRILVVDDGSKDSTQELIESFGREGYPVEVLERGKRLGIGSAIRDGLSWCLARGDVSVIITMDADLSHDPSEIPNLLGALSDSNLVQGSRYTSGGQIVNWTWRRRLLSLGANTLVHILLRTGMKDHTSFFRAYSRRAAEAAITAEGCDSYDWALGSLVAVRAHGLPVHEVPIICRERSDGESKLNIEAMLGWLGFVIREGTKGHSWTRSLVKFPRFALVGASGIVVNQVLLFLLFGILGMWPLVALSIGIEGSILWNFMLNERWTFDTERKKGGPRSRLVRYHAVCALGIGINLAIFAVLHMALNVNYLVSNLIAILAAFTANLRGSVSWAWQTG